MGLMKEDLFEYAVILAGGKSSRMGFDKQLLMKDNMRLAVGLVKSLKESFKQVVVVTKNPEYYEGLDVITCQDIYPGKGPLAGIHSAFVHTDAKTLFVLACDMTSFSPEYAEFEAEKMVREGTNACVTMNEDKMEPFHGFYNRELLPAMEEGLKADKNSLFRLLSKTSVSECSLEEVRSITDPARLFRNLNTPEDYQSFKKEKENGI